MSRESESENNFFFFLRFGVFFKPLFLFFKFLFIYLFGCVGSSLLARGLLFVVVHRLLIAVASLAAEDGL